MNENTFEKLEYNELKELVKSYCVSSLGKALFDKQAPSSNLKVVEHRLKETTEARKILDSGAKMPFMNVSNIDFLVDKVEKGIILTAEELVYVNDFLRGCRRIIDFMSTKEFLAPTLSSYVNSMTELRSLEEEISIAIKNNRVDSHANKELKRVRSFIDGNEMKIKDKLNKYINSNKNYVQEGIISVKNDRYTVPIKASYKNQVNGTIIELSSKGTTAYVEPSVVRKLSDELEGLKAEESMIEYQILATLTGIINDNLHTININIDLIAQYDMINARARFSKSIDGISPHINDYGKIKLLDCKHPLLTGDIVPLDFDIGKDYRSLVITGPNAGGKTIVLKTIGLITLATMSGFHISASEDTEVAVFDQIFVDLGDNQSLENALSTFSSHMKNLSDILPKANNNTLLLFDEIGSGTEPNEGAALAIALLEEFYHKGCITVATTHYGEIKRYSEMHSDFMNAAMQFNQETLEPLFQLQIGKSGDSNALWISRKMKVPEHVLTRAEKYMVDKEYGLEVLDQNKVKKEKIIETTPTDTTLYEKGDRVKLLDYNDFGLVYELQDKFSNVTVYYQNEMIDVNKKRLKLEQKAKDLYPDDYDLDALFTDYQTRKWQHDIERGSKKALRKIEKEIKKNK
ncbi:endonuclease MutS2 [Jeotgalicoccus meleagridis]|uniref:Endonuclease MutS2 n=1 Tax=Jeotgalicoccus meleagridis TaxID=2759181 RepID=A0A6V7R4A2_9STAP|nr:endonuclease MutS2 [Jeotgalicoccus meleagridis]CAD2071873.1 Endonuclease MutS2 [Jeotgalicoccus meleagridis]